jgi:acetoin utilization protein AcuB
MKTQVMNWMTKHPLKVDINEDVRTASRIMKDETISHLLIFDSGWLLGVLSDKDLQLVEKIKKRFSQDCQPRVITVGDLMSRDPVTICEEASMTDAIRLMRERDFRSLPIVNKNNVVVGILTQTDIMKYALVASQSLENHGDSYSKIMSGK